MKCKCGRKNEDEHCEWCYEMGVLNRSKMHETTYATHHVCRRIYHGDYESSISVSLKPHTYTPPTYVDFRSGKDQSGKSRKEIECVNLKCGCRITTDLGDFALLCQEARTIYGTNKKYRESINRQRKLISHWKRELQNG